MTSNGGVIRTEVRQIRNSGRATMGVRLVDLAKGNELVAVDRNVEEEAEESAEATAKAEAESGKGNTGK